MSPTSWPWGAAVDVHPHVPTKVGQVGTAVLWESTGAADALPFWNTNLRGDVPSLLPDRRGADRVQGDGGHGNLWQLHRSHRGHDAPAQGHRPPDISRAMASGGSRSNSSNTTRAGMRWAGSRRRARGSPRLDGLTVSPGPPRRRSPWTGPRPRSTRRSCSAAPGRSSPMASTWATTSSKGVSSWPTGSATRPP